MGGSLESVTQKIKYLFNEKYERREKERLRHAHKTYL